MGKVALREFPSLLLSGLRVGLAGVFMLPAYWWEGRKMKDRWTREDVPALLWLALFGVALNQMFFVTGLSRTSVAHSAIIMGLTPISVLLVAALVRLEALTARKAAGMLVALGGVAILKAFENSGQGPTWTGDLLTFGAGFTFALFTVFGKRLSGRHTTVTVNTFAFVAGGLALAPRYAVAGLELSVRAGHSHGMAGAPLHGAVSLRAGVSYLLLRPDPHTGLARLRLLLFTAAGGDAAGGGDSRRAHHGAAGGGRRRDLLRRLPGGAGLMAGFFKLLRDNPNYRCMWTGQVVSEIGDHFNNIAVFSLALANTRSGLVVSGIMLSRAVPAVLAGPIAGVLLDRMDRRRVMIASDLVRGLVALGFILTTGRDHTWLLYLFSALLMFASPFFTSGRSSILPRITTREELHTANSLTQTTQWTTLTIGTFLAGASVMPFGYKWAFLGNSLSFFVSAAMISRLRPPKDGFAAKRQAVTEAEVVRPWHEYKEGLRYMRSSPLVLGIAMIGVGWATGGGAAQILFSIFGEEVFNRGPAGIGEVWGCAGIGLLAGGALGHWWGGRASFGQYKRTIVLCYIVHGGAYILFSQMRNYYWALFFIALSRAGVAVSSVLNMSQLLRHVPDGFRGRVFSTMESMVWSTMMVSMMLAGVASQYWDPRIIGAVSGALSSTTAIFWGWANWTGRLPEPAAEGVPPDEVEVHGEPIV